MALVNPYAQYRQVQVSTANQLKLIIMLYDGAIGFIRQAQEARQNGREEEAYRLTNRAQDIVFELWTTLNLEAGEVAGNLYRLYEYINGRLVTANIRKEAGPLVEAAELLSGLREAWRALAEGERVVG